MQHAVEKAASRFIAERMREVLASSPKSHPRLKKRTTLLRAIEKRLRLRSHWRGVVARAAASWLIETAFLLSAVFYIPQRKSASCAQILKYSADGSRSCDKNVRPTDKSRRRSGSGIVLYISGSRPRRAADRLPDSRAQ